MLQSPVSVYINWAAYDELSDKVELTEDLAMRQLYELLRLREAGIRFDYYMMDAFWYQPDGGYRTWRTPHWPKGPDRWLRTCLEHGVKPGLWMSGNSLCHLDVAPEWRDSYDDFNHGLCMFHGGFMAHWMETFRHWYARGVRLFKLDFMQLCAAPDAISHRYTPSEIRAMNIAAFRQGLSLLRDECPDIKFMGYNGLEEYETQSGTNLRFRKTVDPHWLDVLDAVYCGDPRPADVPAMNFWRAKDVYSDHMVNVYTRNGFPLAGIDNSGFMIGTTGTCYFRHTAAWKGMLILGLARGGWMNTYYGNLDLLTAEDAAWFAKVQQLYLHLQNHARFSLFGAIPGEAKPYGYLAQDAAGAVCTVVNPAQAVETICLPLDAPGRVLFHDAGFTPELRDGCLTMGPEQMAVVGTECYHDPAYDMGQQDDVRIPLAIEPLPVTIESSSEKAITATVTPPADGCLRIVMRQLGTNGRARRTTGGAPPDGISLGKLLTIEASQNDTPVALRINYDKAIWSGLSWAVAECDTAILRPNLPLTIRGTTRETAEVILQVTVYHTGYAPT